MQLPGATERRAAAFEVSLADFGNIVVISTYGTTGNLDRTLSHMDRTAQYMGNKQGVIV